MGVEKFNLFEQSFPFNLFHFSNSVCWIKFGKDGLFPRKGKARVCATSPFTAVQYYLLSYASALDSVMQTFYSHIVVHVVMFGTATLNVYRNIVLHDLISNAFVSVLQVLLQLYCITCCHMQVPMPLLCIPFTVIL
jgi:hypothetical protein